MSEKKHFFPFNAEQTVNILSEFGPLVTMFVVNAAYGINAGTWSLITTTGIAIAVMFYMFHRPPIFPLIASSVTIVFGSLTLITGDPMWVQIKVTVFNALFAGMLLGGLWAYKNPRQLLNELGPISAMLLVSWLVSLNAGVVVLFALMAVAIVISRGQLSDLDWVTLSITTAFVGMDLVAHDSVWLQTNLAVCTALAVGFLIGAILIRKNFFKYVFEKTFHYSEQGWDLFTRSFAWFFVFTAVMNEIVRQTFKDDHMYQLLGYQLDGVNVWILFKIAIILPLSLIYAWILTRRLQKYRLPPSAAE
jgi:intracellular septation protein